MKPQLAAAGLVAVLFVSSVAAGEPEARVAWNLGFGGATPVLQPRLMLGSTWRTPGDGLPVEWFQLELSTRGVGARLVGAPVAGHGYRSALTEDEGGETGASGETNWLLWAGGAVAAGLALAAAGASVDNCTGYCDDGDAPGDFDPPDGPNGFNGNGVTGANADVEDREAYAGCVNGTCAVCSEDGSVDAQCPGGFVPLRSVRSDDRDFARQRWLDAGTGHMGDLFAR